MDAKRTPTPYKIDISQVASELNAVGAWTKNEFSGVGFCKWSDDNKTLIVYDVVVLDVGTYGWTEIRPEDLRWALDHPDRKNMKLWFHRHPVGRGEPGPQSWSGTDHNTCRNEPLGAAFPPTKGWTASIVLTPTGWSGRIDEYGKDKGTTYVDVVPNFVADNIEALESLDARAVKRYSRIQVSEIGSGQRTALPNDFVDEEFDYFLWDDVDEEVLEEKYQSEGDDGPIHMWVQMYMEGL